MSITSIVKGAKYCAISALTAIVAFSAMIALVPPKQANASELGYGAYEFISMDALYAWGYSSGEDFRSSLIEHITTGNRLNGRRYYNGCIDFVLQNYMEVLTYRGLRVDATDQQKAAAQKVVAAMTVDGARYSGCSSFMRDPELVSICGESNGNSWDYIEINGNLDSILSNLEAERGDIIMLAKGSLTAAHPWKHTAIYQGHGKWVWQATFSYDDNIGSVGYSHEIWDGGDGDSKSWDKVLIFKVAGARFKPSYHAAGGKIIMKSEWEDLCNAYGEEYVRKNVKFSVRVNQDCEIITDFGPDGQATMGGGRDDTYRSVAAGEIIWSGDLTGITPSVIDINGVEYYLFTLPNMPENGAFAFSDADVDAGKTEITITVIETGSMNALFPTV